MVFGPDRVHQNSKDVVQQKGKSVDRGGESFLNYGRMVGDGGRVRRSSKTDG